LLAVSPDGAVLGATRTALDMLGRSAAALRMQGLQAALGITVGQVIDHCRRCGDEPLRIVLHRGGLGESSLYLRAFFNWPTLWSRGRNAVAPPPPALLAAPVAVTTPPATLQALELEAIRRAVTAAGGNISKAARQLGIGRNTLYRKLRKASPGAS
jgi:hypothetical protein